MPRSRDPFIDGLRCVSISRVVLLHLLMRVEHPWIAPFSYVMPGMALIFFVSGALAARSLQSNGWTERRRLWRDRARRLLFPYWAFAVVIGGASIALDLAFDLPWFDVPRAKIACWLVPLAVPEASAPFAKLVWHLWFLVVLVVMLASAPWTLALHRRCRWLGAVAMLGTGVALELAALPVPSTVTHTLLFGSAFLFGFGYGDWRKARPAWLLLGAIPLGAASIAYHLRVAPGTMIHSVDVANIGLSLAVVGVWLAARGPATRVFEHAAFRRVSRAVNARAYSLYLWGPVANEIAVRVLERVPSDGVALYLVLAVLLLLGLVRIFGRVEDWAAGRSGRREDAPRPVPVPRARELRRRVSCGG